jgi:outer membrane biogenesis lipoprotein LolB
MLKSKITILLCATLLLTGCSTVVPVARKFPDAPKFMQACPNLQKLNNEAKLSDIATTVTMNYSTYYECAVKNDAWIEWYQIQKNIFESVK